MTIEQSQLFGNTITYEALASVDGEGDITYDVSIDIPVHLTGKVVPVTDTEGREQVSKAQATTRGYFALEDTGRFTMPSNWPGPSVPRVLAITTSTDRNGPHHQTVYF